MDLAGQHIAVTGATGFLGQYIVDRLLKHNANVVAVVRNPDKVPALKNLDIEFRKADLADTDALSKAFEGLDAVVSNAGQVGASNFEEMVKNNVGGTENVFNALHNAGIKRCIKVSSGSVYKYSGKQIMDETTQLRSATDRKHPLSAYPISKSLAEQRAWELSKKFDIDLTTIRPFGIFGAFDNGTFSWWFSRLMKIPVVPYPVGIDVCLIYAGDVAEAICHCIDRDIARNKAYNICGHPLDAWHFSSIWKQAGGQTSWLRLPVPVPAKLRASNQLAIRELGWEPRPIIESCREMIAAEQRGSHWD